jgi:NhaP-type Na+/H+ or K+/H+ antiporter
LDILSSDLLLVSEGLQKLALIIILIRAGLGINKDDLKKVGGAAIKISFIPCILEGFTIAFLAIYVFGFTFLEGGHTRVYHCRSFSGSDRPAHAQFI